MSTSVPAETLEIDMAYIGSTDNTAWLGMKQGLEEANLQGEFLGQKYAITAFDPGQLNDIDFSRYIAIITAVDHDLFLRISTSQPGMPVFNLTLEDDDLRSACLPNALHIIPSKRMKADAEAQWREKEPGAEVVALAWHPDFEKFAGRDLNKRYLKNWKVKMDDPAWAGWASVKIISDSVARGQITAAGEMLQYLQTQLAFDGQKGEDLNFRVTGQLSQPLILVVNGEIVAEAPVKGVANPPTLDSLGMVDCEK